jgi:hypothetical protein
LPEKERRRGLNAPPQNERDTETIPLPGPLKQKIKDALVALSLANLCFINTWGRPLIDADFNFLNSVDINPTYLLALLANILWLAVVVWLVLQAWHRWQNWWFQPIVYLSLGTLLLVPIFYARARANPKHNLAFLLHQPVIVLAAVVVGCWLLWNHRRVARAATVILAILSPLAVYILIKIALLFFGVIHLSVSPATMTLPPPGPVQAGHPRVVWVIFDEADYRIIFDQRPPGLKLPEFDRLRAESLNADNANSPTDGTLFSMPSLFFGRRLSTMMFTNHSDFAIQFVITNGIFLCSQFPSVFSSARAMGVNTALVGWYLPYAKLFGKDLNFCSQYMYPTLEPEGASTFGTAMLRQIECLGGPWHIQQGFVKMYRQSLADSLHLVTNVTYGLIFLHLLPPHSPGIYLPDKDQLTIQRVNAVTGYFNNLALADRTLGKLRHALETSGEWETTWIIVSADHSWRGSRAYDGQRDYRVPFLVNPPRANTSVVYSQPFNTVATENLVLAILRGQIPNTTSAVAAWLEADAKPRPTVESKFIMP